MCVQIFSADLLNSLLYRLGCCMDEEISFDHEGTTYSCTYNVQGDELVVYLPDGSHRITNLRGLDPGMAALTHLRGFVRGCERSTSLASSEALINLKS